VLLPVVQKGNGPQADLAKRLSGRFRGEVRTSVQDRLLYSTDASLYQVEPLAVLIPIDVEDAQAAIAVCRELKLPILPRGGGTSLAGQCTNRAVVLDLSVNLRKVLSVDIAAKQARVEAGATLDQINRHLAATASGLFYAPDPATAAQATVGGCIGNNAAGARSIKYGRTSENVASVDVVLVNGQKLTLGLGAGRENADARSLATGVVEIVRRFAQPIRQRFPKTIRRNAGYGLDLILRQLDAGVGDEDLDLSGLICGSEGTLAVVLGARLKLQPAPKGRGLCIIGFAALADAIAAVPPINSTAPTAVELLDEVVLEAAAGNNDCRRYLSRLPQIDGKLARAVLYVEYEGSVEELTRSFDRMDAVIDSSLPKIRYTDAAALADLWALRKAGEPLLHRIGGGPNGRSKPQTFVEDNAVPVERLGEFVERFREIVKKHGTTAAYWAHASVGVLHVRPLVDLHEPADREKMRAMAVEVAELARDCGGVMSGEHGDGRVRGPLLEKFYGPELMEAFRQIKRLFDPENLLNPGNIVEPGPVENITENLRMDRQRVSRQLDSVPTYFDYSDQHGFDGAVEMCNGAGVCRKTAGGTMCPSYRALLDERHSTRGRGNALRLAITGQMSDADAPAWDDAETIQTLHLCLSCKACKSECPSNVDISRLKAEYTAQRYRIVGAPLHARLMGHVRILNQLGGVAPGLANWASRLGPVRSVLNRILNLAPQRSLPGFARPLRQWFEARPTQTIFARRVVLYEDCFGGYGESHIGRAAVAVLEMLGYEVLLPRVGCCGRAMISTGLLADAVISADQTLSVLKPFVDDPAVLAVVFLEPSCLSAVKDDWLQLKLNTPLEFRKKLAERSMLVEEFVDRFWENHPRPFEKPPTNVHVLMHGHCHQKALWGEAGTAAALRRVAQSVTVLPSGCCGMAGSFGFTADRYALSMQIGELSVFPPIRSAGAEVVITAPGTSCRHQILDGTARHALHPIEIIAETICETK
jgi:FAD/FMN-containing dehydrogenase/Fe-S oxidoreductase